MSKLTSYPQGFVCFQQEIFGEATENLKEFFWHLKLTIRIWQDMKRREPPSSTGVSWFVSGSRRTDGYCWIYMMELQYLLYMFFLLLFLVGVFFPIFSNTSWHHQRNIDSVFGRFPVEPRFFSWTSECLSKHWVKRLFESMVPKMPRNSSTLATSQTLTPIVFGFHMDPRRVKMAMSADWEITKKMRMGMCQNARSWWTSNDL